MGAFDNYRISWDGKPYVIPARRRVEAIARVEDHITLPELYGQLAAKKTPFGKISLAYGAVLRLAGCDVTDDEVYQKLAPGGSQLDQAEVISLIQGLLELMLPPPTLADPAKESPEGNLPRRARKRVARSSK